MPARERRHVEGNAAADQRSRNSTEHQIGVGDGRLSAALGVTHGAGIGARAFRADLEMVFTGEPRDRAAAGADRLDVDHRNANREGADRATVGDVRLAAFDQAEVGRGAARIQRHNVREAGHLGNHGAAQRAGGGAGEGGGDRLAHHLGGACDTAARLHDQERLVLEIAELVMDAAQVALHVRLDERVDQRGHCALVFTVLRQHLAGQRERALRIVLGENLADPPFMRGVGVGMHQADADRADVLLAEDLHGGADARFIERPQLRTPKIEPATDFAHKTQRHDAVGFHPKVRIAVALRDRLPGDFENVAKAVGHDQPERVDLALQQRVGRNGGAVRHAGDARRRAADLLQDRANATRQRDPRIGGRAGNLGDGNRARGGID